MLREPDITHTRVPRILTVSISDWYDWQAAAQLVDVSRNTFITAACNAASALLKEKYGRIE